jgi:hypothetical protein
MTGEGDGDGRDAEGSRSTMVEIGCVVAGELAKRLGEVVEVVEVEEGVAGSGGGVPEEAAAAAESNAGSSASVDSADSKSNSDGRTLRRGLRPSLSMQQDRRTHQLGCDGASRYALWPLGLACWTLSVIVGDSAQQEQRQQ